MKKFDLKIIQRFFILTAFAGFLFVSLIVNTHLVGMQMNSKEQMANCIFNTQPGPCAMTVSEHISIMQEMFTATPGTMGAFNITLLLSLIFVTLVFGDNLYSFLSEDKSSRQLLYLKERCRRYFLNPLQEAFSQGILNSKIYEFVTI